MTTLTLKDIEERVSVLEGIVVVLAKLAQINDDLLGLGPLILRTKAKTLLDDNRESDEENTLNVKRATARKSTSGIKKTRNAKAQGIRVEFSSGSRIPDFISESEIDIDDIDPVIVKVENADEDDIRKFDDDDDDKEWFFNLDRDYGDTNPNDNYELSTDTDSGNDPSPTAHDDDIDDGADNDKIDCLPLRRRKNRTKFTSTSTSKKIYFKPLHVPSHLAVGDGPRVVLENLTAPQLQAMNVTLVRRASRGSKTIIRLHREPSIFKCFKCHQIFMSRTERNAHKKTCGTIYKCGFCHIKFPTKQQKVDHFNSEHRYSIRTCPVAGCGKTFKRKLTYTQHLTTHSDARPFLCNMCGNALKSDRALRLHMKLTHSDIRLFKCDECDVTYKRRSRLQKHKTTEHDPNFQMLPCHLCKGSFKDSRLLKRHINEVHNDIRSIPCPKCPEMFKRLSLMKKHLRNHDSSEHNQKPMKPRKKRRCKWNLREPQEENAAPELSSMIESISSENFPSDMSPNLGNVEVQLKTDNEMNTCVNDIEISLNDVEMTK